MLTRQHPLVHVVNDERRAVELIIGGIPLVSALRYIWTAPTTILGLLLAATAWRRGAITIVDGVVEAHGPFIRWALRHVTLLPGGVAAITLGHVVLGVDAATLEKTRAHERVHVAQYERWGPLFLPAYLFASVWAAVRGRHFYFANAFEVDAFVSEVGE